MIWAIFRTSAAQFNVDSFLKRHPALQPDAVWREGERETAKRTSDTSGFNVSLAEGENFEEVLAQTRHAAERLEPALQELAGLNIEVEIDFGMTVGEEKSFAPSARFPPEALAWFSERGLMLVVSAYPSSDEDE
ncbi:hypothetical protein POL68_31360 [Stigmatella sp. ncwal1]|uniref:DUF4279 domain-containing protein n=1 Tax=Stigmatella ashevillensis TaxID=2995309 RepID=A0ABT5DH60_9BACT|nr:hypothetical protein [Stigmatella ashevillena]MDC0713002.1 hypothetical protein [Stigmatella ashevillena]